MEVPPLDNCFLEGEIGTRIDRFILERVSGKFALDEILRETEDFLKHNTTIFIHLDIGVVNSGAS